eukprot:TRINITY_DN4281_c0_g1_i1.p6 TRINITY_DN4281_c0_g1~~TRINITY_DN4281_c0_g1_i1.p6  ORF type:complete len:125 (+),score=12.12 TRINITY_DN4281_c0_g1_i1:2018-2392(+)
MDRARQRDTVSEFIRLCSPATWLQFKWSAGFVDHSGHARKLLRLNVEWISDGLLVGDSTKPLHVDSIRELTSSASTVRELLVLLLKAVPEQHTWAIIEDFGFTEDVSVLLLPASRSFNLIPQAR